MKNIMTKLPLLPLLHTLALIILLLIFPAIGAAEDPASLDLTIDRIRTMHEQNSSNREIAVYLSAVIDRRLSSTNRVSFSGGDSYGMFLPGPAEALGGAKSEWSRRFDRFNQDRETFGKQLGGISRSDLTERAIWSWDNRVGNCNEAQAVSYYILSRAGIPARTITSNAGSGHDFVVIGATEGFNANKPSTWGPDAMVVDGWTGEALTPAEASESSYHGNEGQATMSDRTGVIVKPDQDRFWSELSGKGILFVHVTDKKTKHGIDGATVRVQGNDVNVTETTSHGGKVTLTLPVGNADIQVTPPSQDYEPASRTAEISEQRRLEVSIALEPVMEEEIIPLPVAAGRLVGEGSVPYAMQASGAVRVTNNRGQLTLNMSIDVEKQSVSGTLDGSFSATLISDQSQEQVSATLTGPISGSFSGTANSGTFNGTTSLTQSGTGGTVQGSGSFSGSLSNGGVYCLMLLGEDRFEFRFPVRQE